MSVPAAFPQEPQALVTMTRTHDGDRGRKTTLTVTAECISAAKAFSALTDTSDELDLDAIVCQLLSITYTDSHLHAQ